jgi:hypothetical protein
MLDHKRGELAACTTSDATFMSRSGRAWILALLGAASLALFAAGPASADPNESTRTKEVIVSGDLLDTTLNPMFRRPCGTSPHGTRRHIPDPRGGPDSVIECINGTWVPVD